MLRLGLPKVVIISISFTFELKKGAKMSTVMKKSFDKGLNEIANAFEKRAIKLFKNI